MKGYCLALEKPSAIYAANILIEDRIDADAYNYLYIKEISKLKFSGLKLANITDFYSVEMLTGFENSKYINYTNQGIPFIRCKNIRDNYFDEDDLTYISEEVYNILKRAQLSDDDLLYTKTGSNLGQVCCVPKGMKAIASSNCCFFKKSQNKSIDSHYVSTFLNSKYGKVQTNRAQTKTGQPTIDFQRLKQFLIPIPSPEIQKYIGDKVRKAEELREEAKRLKKEAEEILINEIGFNNVNKGNAKYHWIKEDIVDDRIDSDFYDLKYQVLIEIEKKFNCYLMEDIIVDKYTGKTPGKEYDDIKGIPLIVVKNVEENILNLDNIDRRIKDNNSFKKTEENDLLITRVGSVGVVSIVEENEKGLFLSDNVICLKLKEGLFNRYIAFYLNSIYGKLMVERWTKGAVQGVINYESINKFKIPIMDNNIMKEIDLKILKWKQLLAISKQLIQEAKQDVEDLIEGNFDMSKVKANS